MNRKIYIIHSSEIVRKGIFSILKTYMNIEILMIESLEKVDFNNKTEGCNVIIFQEYFDSFNQSKLHQIKSKNNVKIVGVSKNGEYNKNVHGFSECITLNSSSSEIAEIVSELFSQTDNVTTTKIDNSELSLREKDVLTLVALGNTNKDIAEKLFISIHTVISHRKNITEKLGIKSISGLTVYAIINKLIDADTIDLETLI